MHVETFKQSNLWPDNQNQIPVYVKKFFKEARALAGKSHVTTTKQEEKKLLSQ